MPKTQNAFAFRDFDAARILQRRFFKEFHFAADKSDAEILQSLTASAEDNLPTLESKQAQVKKLWKKIARLMSLTVNHTKRLDFYRKAIKKKFATVTGAELESLQLKFNRENKLATEYVLGINFALGELITEAQKQWQKLDEIIQKRYREIFAERLKKARLKANLSRQDLADVLNITANAYGLYENGGRSTPSFISIIKLARALKVKTDWLTGVT